MLHNKGSDLLAPMDKFLIILSLYNPKAEDSLDDAMMQSIKIYYFCQKQTLNSPKLYFQWDQYQWLVRKYEVQIFFCLIVPLDGPKIVPYRPTQQI